MSAADAGSLWLVGAGPMARAYARVLAALGRDFEPVGRGEASAVAFERETSRAVRRGGLAAFLAGGPAPAAAAIVAAPVMELGACTLALIEHGVPRLLVEKPAGLDRLEIERVAARAAARGTEVYVGYNRRFFASTAKALELIAADGGATSLEFEFTEKTTIGDLPHPPAVKANWFLANSTHVVDLAFFLAGEPMSLAAEVAGALPWHPRGAVFTGAGRTERGVLFSYRADWSSAGNWGVDVYTAERRLVLRRLETLQQQRRGAMTLEPVALDDSLDQPPYKPGIYRQVLAFLEDERGTLCSMEQHCRRLGYYDRMAGYGA